MINHRKDASMKSKSILAAALVGGQALATTD
jgi:hypothetical protein